MADRLSVSMRVLGVFGILSTGRRSRYERCWVDKNIYKRRHLEVEEEWLVLARRRVDLRATPALDKTLMSACEDSSIV